MDEQYKETYDYITKDLKEFYETGYGGDLSSILINSSTPYSKSNAQNRLFFMIYEAIREGKHVMIPSKVGKISIKIFDYSKKFLKRRIARKYCDKDDKKIFFNKDIDSKLENRMKDLNKYVDELYKFRVDKEYHINVMNTFYNCVIPEFKRRVNYINKKDLS